MVHRLLLSSAVILLTTLTLSVRANADAGGDVQSNCIFFGVDNGELGLNPNGKILSSTESGGRPATISIDCNGEATLTISKPKQINIENDGTTEFLDQNLSARATSNDLPNIDILSGDAGDAIAAEASGTITVNMEATHSNKIAPGEYTFTVTITATP